LRCCWYYRYFISSGKHIFPNSVYSAS